MHDLIKVSHITQATIYGAGYDLANQTAYLDSMLRWGLDWAMRVSQQSDQVVFPCH
jgi:hypothetical protein